MKDTSLAKRVLVRSSVPVFAAAGAFALYAVCFPLYRLGDVVMAAAVSALVYIVCGVFAPFRFYWNPVKESPVLEETGDGAADAVLLSMQGYIAFCKELEAAGHPLSARLAAIRGLTEDMRAHILTHPAQARQLRKTAEYYLPTVQKLAAAYGGGNTDGRIETALDTVADAFRKQLTQLHESRALDVETDIAVLRQVLAREGLADLPPKAGDTDA